MVTFTGDDDLQKSEEVVVRDLAYILTQVAKDAYEAQVITDTATAPLQAT